MNYLAILSILVIIISIYIGFFSLKLDYKSKLNRIFFLLIVSFIIWNLGYLFIYESHTVEACIIWHKISAIGWCFSISFFLHFALILTKNENLLRKPLIIFLIYLPSLLFFIKNSITDITTIDFVYENNSFYNIIDHKSIWYRLFIIYAIIYSLISSSIIWTWGAKSKKVNIRKQTHIIVYSLLISLIGGIIVNALNSYQSGIPPLSHYFAFFSIIGIWYTIVKYKLMVLTPEIAIDEILSKIKDLLLLVNPEGRIILVNKQVENLLGYKAANLIGQNFNEITYNAEEFNTEFFKISTGMPYCEYLEIDYKTSNNQRIPVSASISVMKNNQNEFIGVVVVAQDMRQTRLLQNDIKERVKVEQFQNIVYSISKAANSSENLNQLYEKIYHIIHQNINTNNFYIALCDEQTKTISFPYFIDEFDEAPEPRQFKNGLTERIFNIGKPALITRHDFFKLVENKDIDLIGTPCREWLGVPLIAKNKKFGVIVVQNYNETSSLTQQEKDLLIFVSEQVAMSIDIKRVEESLKNNAELLKKAEELAKICSWEYNFITNQFVFSESFGDLFEIPDFDAKFTHNDFINMIYIEDKDLYIKNVMGVFDFKASEYDFEFRIINKNNVIKYYRTIGISQKNAKNEPQKIVASIQDITEQKKNEELINVIEVTKQTAELKQQFFANMSHEIRTPLNAIIGFANLLEKENFQNNQITEYVKTITSSSNTLLVLINDILDLTKIDAGKLEIKNEPVNLVSIINDVKTMLSIKLNEKNLNLFLELDPTIPYKLYLDETRIRQILINLIGNAIKFTETGYVKIKAYHKFSKKSQGLSNIFIEVIDTGIGIPEEQQKIIFESFSQVSGQSFRKYGGTGLGLSITKRLVEAMGGEIKLSSQKDIGSTFSFIIPDVLVSIDESKDKLGAEYFTNLNILKDAVFANINFTENEIKIFNELADISSINNVSINYNNAFEKLLENTPDIIFLKLPENIQIEIDLLNQIKSNEELSSVPIVAIIDQLHSTNIEDLKLIGIDGFIRTPFKLNELNNLTIKYLSSKNKEKTKSSTQNQNFTNVENEINEELKKNLPRIINILEVNLMEDYNQIKKTSNINLIKDFANKIIKLGNTYKLTIIKAYGEDLLKNANSFNITKVNKLINSYQDLLNALNNLIKK